MKTTEVRKRYLEFFQKRGHALIPSGLLVPENDPTTLFTGSGMQPLLPYLLGESHPAGRRLVNSQKCFRAEDIDEVGDNRHTTFFEMLGNWSLGDYFKDEQLRWFFEFLTDREDGIGLDSARLYVTVFGGDEQSGIARDDEAATIWQKLFQEKGIDAKIAEIGSEDVGSARGIRVGERIFYYGAKKNWWSRAGEPAKMPEGEPGGPDSEVFFDFDPSGAMHDARFGANCHPNCDCGRFMEIGNSVFMQYRKRADGGFDELPQKNVDFGGGLERITAASGGDPDVFRIDVLRELIEGIESRTVLRYGADERTTRSFRIVADHLRGAVFMIGDGVLSANKEQGYFVRRLLRRAVRHMDLLGMRENTLHELVALCVGSYADQYPILSEQMGDIRAEIQKEEEKFRLTLALGLKKLSQLVAQKRKTSGVTEIKGDFGPGSEHYVNMISGADAFDLYQTYGFPADLIEEELAREAMTYNKEEFKKAFTEAQKEHQEKSRAGAERKFHGGLADHSEVSVRYHTATHLLHQALRDILGEHVFQKGSNITPDRLRFDFVHPRKMTTEEIGHVEKIVNERIADALPVTFEILPLEKARRRGAIGLFGDQYGTDVKVYKIGEGTSLADGLYSFEFCGGPHVANTRELGEGGKRFKITKEEAISSGIRRIRAVLAVVF